MSSKSPYLTLAGAAAVFAALIAVNMAKASDDDSGDSGGGGYGASDTSATEPSDDEPTESEPSDDEPTEPTETEQTEEGEPEFPERAVFAGHTAKSGPAIAIAILDDDAAAYFCDGVSAESWLKGSADDGEFSLSGSGGDSVEGRLVDGSLVGKVTVQDRTYRFVIPRAKAPAGLYRADLDDGDTTIGWIVLPDGTQVGIENSDGNTAPAPTLTPGDPVEIDGQDVTARVVTGEADF